MSLDAKNLESFLRLYETKSIRKAAAELYISPQGLSRMIQNLEGELGVLLFERSPQGMRPTDAGAYFYQHAKELLKSYQDLSVSLKNIANIHRDLQILCSYGTMNALPYERFLRFQEEYPEYNLKWREYPDSEALRQMEEGSFDLGLLVLRGGELDEAYQTTPLFSRKIVLLVYEGHPLYERDAVSFADLKQEKIIMEGNDFFIFKQFQEKCLASGFLPDIAAETGDISFCHKLCSMKQGLSISVDFVAEFIKTEGVRVIPFSDYSFSWDVYLIYKKKQVLTAAAEKFIAYLLHEFA